MFPALALAYLWAAPTSLRPAILAPARRGGPAIVLVGRQLRRPVPADAGLGPALHGRLRDQQLPGTDLRLQRPGPDHRLRQGGRGGGGDAGGGGGGMRRRMSASAEPPESRGCSGPASAARCPGCFPSALILLGAGLWFTRRKPARPRTRAALILWGGWLLVTAGILSFMGGTVHPYYAVALAPAIAALVGIGSVELWRGRAYWPARIMLAATVLAGSVWSAVLLGRDTTWLPWIRVAVVILGVLAAVALLLRLDSRQAIPARLRRTATADCYGCFAAGRRARQHCMDLCHGSPAALRVDPDVGSHRIRHGRTRRPGRTRRFASPGISGSGTSGSGRYPTAQPTAALLSAATHPAVLHPAVPWGPTAPAQRTPTHRAAQGQHRANGPGSFPVPARQPVWNSPRAPT